MPLIELTYVSFAVKPMSADELEDILLKSKKNNAERDITGMLLYRDRYFIQALEGEEKVVESLYKRIMTDPRHSNVLLVAKEAIMIRTFNKWSMGFSNLDYIPDVAKKRIESLDGFTNFLSKPVDAKFFAQTPTRAKVLLSTFKEGALW